MRISDWSSDVCSSDLIWGTSLGGRNVLLVAARDKRVKCVVSQVPGMVMTPEMLSYFGGCDGDVAAFQQALADDKRNRAEGKEPRYIYIAGEDLDRKSTRLNSSH